MNLARGSLDYSSYYYGIASRNLVNDEPVTLQVLKRLGDIGGYAWPI